MTTKTALVTGATNGIGLETARTLAHRGLRVLLHGRNARKGQALTARIRMESGNAEVHFVQADFAALDDVRAMAQRVADLAPRLDVLVNNAGCANATRRTSRDGYELTFAVNHLAPFLLTNLLLVPLEAAAPARIVNVSSAAHRGQQIDFDDLMSEREYKLMRAYGRSKLANILFTRALARRLQGSGVAAYCLHPGVVRTGIGQNNLLARIVGGAIMWWAGVPVSKGAATSLYLATAEHVAGQSGEYFKDCRPAALLASAQAVNDAAVERLWQVSAGLVGLSGRTERVSARRGSGAESD